MTPGARCSTAARSRPDCAARSNEASPTSAGATASGRCWPRSWSAASSRRASTSTRSCARAELVGVPSRVVELPRHDHRRRAARAARGCSTTTTSVAGIIVQMPLPRHIPLSHRDRHDPAGQGHRRHPSAQRRADDARLRRLPARLRGGRRRDPASAPATSSKASGPSSSAAAMSSASRSSCCSCASTARSPSATGGRATCRARYARAEVVVTRRRLTPAWSPARCSRPARWSSTSASTSSPAGIVGDVDFATRQQGGRGDHAGARRRRAGDQRRPARAPAARGALAADRPPDHRRPRAQAPRRLSAHAPSPHEDRASRSRARPGCGRSPSSPPSWACARTSRPVRPLQGQGPPHASRAPRRRARRARDRGHGDHPDAARRGQDDHDHRPRPGPQPHRRACRADHPPAVARARSSASRAARRAAATARSCRWRTSTSTSPATCTRSPPPTTWPRRSSTTTSSAATRWSIDPATIRWPRVIDVNDRALRRVMLGLGEAHGRARVGVAHHRRLGGHGDPRAGRRHRRTCARGSAASIVGENYDGEPVTLERPARSPAR